MVRAQRAGAQQPEGQGGCQVVGTRSAGRHHQRTKKERNQHGRTLSGQTGEAFSRTHTRQRSSEVQHVALPALEVAAGRRPSP